VADKRRLYDLGYNPTERMKELRDPECGEFKFADLLVLWEVYKEGTADAGVHPNMVDFGSWVSATKEYEGLQPAEVVW
jgi:hypothetical protein